MLDVNISRYIWRHTRPQQLWILAIVALSMIPYFMAFNLPKQIVNGPIQGEGFADPGATQLFMRLAPEVPGYGTLVLFPGLELDRFATLFALSGVFLALVIINGLFKYYINTYKGRLGERLLRRIRFTLVDHVLRFPPSAFKRVKGAEISSMVKDEVEPLGGFTGDAFVAPALLGGQALTALVFIFIQSVPLGLIAAALVGVQIFIIPRMRRRLLVLGRERQLTARELAGRVSEIVDGIGSIHAYDTSNFERADISRRLGRIFRIRLDIYQWKFLVKFINNFLAALTPFLFYSIGGYLALTGRLDVGQLVAVIGAYRDLPGPLKELIDWDQNRQDVQIKYQQVIAQFAMDGMLDPEIQGVASGSNVIPLKQPLATVNLGVVDDSGVTSLEHTSFTLRPGEAVAVVGLAGSGSETLAEALGRVVWPSSGKITAGDSNLLVLPESTSGRSITYVAGEGYFFSGSVLDNLLYGLKNAPQTARDYSGADLARRQWEQHEAALSGNPDFDTDSDWIDYAALGVAGKAQLLQRVPAVLDTVLLMQDIQEFGLRSILTEADSAELGPKIVTLRASLHRELAGENLGDLIVPFEPDSYNPEATVIENILFGTARRPDLMPAAIGANPYFRDLLGQHGMQDKLVQMGLAIARTVVDLFSDLPPDHPFFAQMTFMTADDIPGYQLLIQKFDNPASEITEEDRVSMIRLTFDYVETRHRFGLLTPGLMADLVALRTAFHAGLPDALKGGIEVYDPRRYNMSATLLDNILFGRISQKYRDGADQIRTTVARLLPAMDLADTVLSIGLQFAVGSGGKRLTAAQRQKLGLARALIRTSDYYVLNRPLSALDNRAQERILTAVLERLRGAARPPGIVWVVSNPQMARHFDRVTLFGQGRLVDEGTPDALGAKNGIFREMIAS